MKPKLRTWLPPVVALVTILVAYSTTTNRWSASIVTTEVSPLPLIGEAPWVEFYNPVGGEPVPTHRLHIGTGESDLYRLPRHSEDISPGGYVLVRFDSTPGRDSVESRADNVIVVHAPTGLSESWRNGAGVLFTAVTTAILGRPERQSRVVWAPPGVRSGVAPRHEEPRDHRVVFPGFGDYSTLDEIRPGDSLGLYHDEREGIAGSWTVFRYSERPEINEVTPGSENSVPRPTAFTLPDGAVVGSGGFGIGWVRLDRRERYELELKNAADPSATRTIPMSSPRIRWDDGLAEGVFTYRVRRFFGSRWSPWSTPRDFKIVLTPCGKLTAPAVTMKVLKEMRQRYQRKDTRLRCQYCSCAPDQPHKHEYITPQSTMETVDPPNCESFSNAKPNDHGDLACSRASISMLISCYDKCLSQDVIAYSNEGDLGHGYGMVYCRPPPTMGRPANQPATCLTGQLPPGGEHTKALLWAFGIPSGANITADLGYFTHAPPTFAGIRSWIDADRPIMTRLETQFETHVRALNGYCVDIMGREWLSIRDPYTGPRWEEYTTWKPSAVGLWVGPPYSWVQSGGIENLILARMSLIKEDPAGVWKDSDQDGVVDFDEDVRGLGP